MANGDLTPDNIQFQQEEFDPAVTPQVFPDAPSDLEYDLMLQQFSESVNNVVYPVEGSSNSITLGSTGPQYNPYKSKVKLSDTEESLLKEINNISSGKTINTKPLMPIMTNKRLTNYERYYNHPKFNELGFNPFRDNESIYNANSTFMDDFSRMSGQFSKLLYTGFVSSYRSLGDIFDDDSYFTGKDLDSAREFADAMRIGNSTKGGVGGFMNNLALQSGYTFGIIGNIMVEEAVLSFATGGGSLFTAPLRTAGKITKSAANLMRGPAMAATAGAIVNKLKGVENSKTFWQATKTGDSKLMGWLLPETMQTRKLLNSGSNATKNLSDLAKNAKTFGGFYRDFRGLNFAIAEAKMEGGMVYDQRIANGLASRMEVSETGVISDEDIQIIKDGANKASFYTTTLNAPFIYFSNQFLLGNAFGSYNRSLARMLGNNTDAVMKRIIRKKPVISKTGQVTKGLAEKVGPGIGGAIKKRFSDGLLSGTAGGAMRYFSANFGEGIQEVYQEAVSHGTGHYYDAIIKDPTLSTRNLLQSSISEAMSSQISGQGFHTFMSGFMMGGLVGPVQNFVFSGVPNFTQKFITNREQFKKDQLILEKAIDQTVEQYNSLWSDFQSDPSKFLDVSIVNTIIQKQSSEDKQAAMEKDWYNEFISNTDVAKFQNAYSLVSTNAANMFRDQLKDYLKMSDEDLQTAFPAQKGEVQDGKIKERINSYLKDIDRIEDLYNENKDKYINPFDPSMYDRDNPAQFRDYIEESLKHEAYNHIRYLAIFSQNQLIRAGERITSLFKALETDPIYKGMAANDITVLLSEKSIRKEMANLQAEIELLDDSKENYQEKREKELKLKFISEFNVFFQEKHKELDRLKNKKNQKGKRTEIDWRKEAKLKKLLTNYVNFLSKDQYVDESKMSEYVRKIFDYSQLQIDQAKYVNSILALADPTKFDELFGAAYKKKREIFDNGIEIYRKTIVDYANNQNIKNWLNTLADLGIYIDPEEVIEFIKSEDKDVNILKTFYNIEGEILDEKGIINMKAMKLGLEKILIGKKEEEEIEEEDVALLSDEIKEIIKKHNLKEPKEESIDEDIELEIGKEFVNVLFKKFPEELSKENFSDKYKDDINNLILSFMIAMYNKSVDVSESTQSLNSTMQLIEDYLNNTLESKYQSFIQNSMEQLVEGLENEVINESLAEMVDNYKETEALEGQEFSDEEIVIETEETEETEEQEGVTPEKKVFEKRILDEIALTVSVVVTEIEGVKSYHLGIKNEDGIFIPITPNIKEYLGLQKNSFSTLEEANETLLNLKPDDTGKVFTVTYNGKTVHLKNGTTVYDKNNKEHTIISILGILKNDTIQLLDENNSVKPYFLETFFDNFTTVKNKTRKGSNSISSVNNGVEIIPAGVNKEAFSLIMMHFGLENSTDFAITIERNTEAPAEEIFQPNKNEKPNPNIKRKQAPFRVNIVLTDAGLLKINGMLNKEGLAPLENNLVGFLNTGNLTYLYNNTPIENPLDMTFEQAKLYYKNLDKNKFDELRNNFATTQVMVEALEAMLETEASLVLTPEEFSEQTNISFNLKQSKFHYKKDNPKTLEDIHYSETIIFRTVKDKKTGDIRWEPAEGTNIPDSEIQKYINFANNYKNKQGYLGVAKLPNGKLAYIPLKSRKLTPEEAKESIDKIKEAARDESISLTEFNQELGFYVALKSEQYVNIYLTPGRDLVVSYNQKKEGETEFTVSITIKREELEDLYSLEQIFEKINKDIKKVYDKKGKSDAPVLSEESFRRNFPKRSTVDTIAKNTTTDLQPRIYSKYNFIIQADTNSIIELKNKVKNNKQEEKEEEKNKIQKFWESILDFKSGQGTIKEQIGRFINNIEDAFGFKVKSKEFKNSDKGKGIYLKIEGFEKTFFIPASGIRLGGGAYETLGIDRSSLEALLGIAKEFKNSLSQQEERLNREKKEKKDKEIALSSTKTKKELIEEKEQLIEELNRLNVEELLNEEDKDLLKGIKIRKEKINERVIEIENLLGNIANLIISDSHTERSVEDINTFINWLQENLPEFISVRDINELKNNMLKGGTRVGAFMMALKDISGNMQPGGLIFTSKTSSGKYHEAFHAVFRLLLTDQEISKYLKVGKKELKQYLEDQGKNYKKELANFRNKSEAYKLLSPKQLEELYIEEYIAERFDEFKSDPKKTKTHFSLKSLFNRIKQFILDILGRWHNRNNKDYNLLNELFISIDSGKYKSANLMDNRFVNEFKMGSNPIVNSMVPYDKKGDNAFYYLDSNTGEALINQIYARVIDLQDKSTGEFNIDAAIKESIDLYIKLHTRDLIAGKTQVSSVLLALKKYSGVIKEEVNERLKFINLTQNKLDELEEDEQIEIGLNTSSFNMKAELLGMEKSLPGFLKKYISSTTMTAVDSFGNTMLTEDVLDEDGNVIQKGEPIVTSVNFADVYSGILRATHGIFDHGEMLTALILFSENGNPETRAVIDRLLLDIGVSREDILGLLEEGDPSTVLNLVVKKPALLHRILKAFENSRFVYRFSKYNEDKGTVESYDAIERGNQKAQIEAWFDKHWQQYENNKREKETKEHSLNLLHGVQIIMARPETLNDTDLRDASNRISKDIFEATGIMFHPNYIFYSLAVSKTQQKGNYGLQKIISNEHKGTIKIDGELISLLQEYVQNDYFIFGKSDNFHAALNKYARGNIKFDESIGSTTFLNPENERIYAHQLPTLNAKFVYALTKGTPEDFIKLLIENEPILKYNYLTSGQLDAEADPFKADVLSKLGDKFLSMIFAGEFSYERIGGIIEEMMSEDSIAGGISREGKSYGKLDMEQFLKIMLANYYGNVKFNGELSSEAAPVFTRVAETSRTGATFQLPALDTINANEEFTDETLQIFMNYIHGEFERIQQESDPNVDSELIEGFNAVQNKQGELVRDEERRGTAYRLFKTSAFLNNTQIRLQEETQSVSNKEAYEKMGNSSTGVVAVGSRTDLAKLFKHKDKNKAIQVTIKKSPKSQESITRIFTYKETSEGNYMLNFVEEVDQFVDSELTTALEEMARDSENKGKDFIEIIKEKYGIEKFKSMLSEKLNGEFNKFKTVLKNRDIDINNKTYENILGGVKVDKTKLKNDRYVNATENREAESNKKLHLIDGQLNHNLKQIFFNHFINSFSINQLIRGDHAKLYPNYQSEIKRGKDAEGHFVSTRSYLYDKTLDVTKPVESFDLIVFQEPKNKSTLSGKDIEEADGQLYMTVNAFRQAMFGIGTLTKEQNEVLNKLERGEKLKVEDVWGVETKSGYRRGGLIANKEMINLKKLLYSDAQVMVKMSAHVLRKEDTSIEVSEGVWEAKDNMIVLHNLRERLEAHEKKTGQPTLAAPVSALKKMKMHINSLQKTLTGQEILGVMKLDASYFGRQQVNPSNKKESTDPTQITYLLENEQNDSQKVIINGESIPIWKIKIAFEKHKSDILQMNYIGKKNLVFDTAVEEFKVFKETGKITPNLLTFLKYAQESLMASNSASDILNFFDMSDKVGFQGILNNPIVLQKYEDLLLSYFSKSVLKQKIPGDQLTMKSDFGDRIYRRVYSVRKVTVNGETFYVPDKQEVIREQIALKTVRRQYSLHIDMAPSDVGNRKVSNPGNEIKNLEGLKELVEAAGEEGVIIIDRMRYDMTEYNIDENTGEWVSSEKKYSEAKIAITDPEVYKRYGKMHQDKEYIFTSSGLETMYNDWKTTPSILENGKLISREQQGKKRKGGWSDEKGKLSFAKSMKTWYDTKTKKFAEVKYTNIPEALSKIFAVRIPTQDKHSALAIKAVDFMSVSNGSTISTAREIVEVSGADFDIDKLFAQFKEYYYDKTKKDFVEMGLDPATMFYEYTIFINKKVNKPGTTYYEAYQKYLEDGLTKEMEVTDTDIVNGEKQGFTEASIYALTMMGLPITPESFEEFNDEHKYYPFEAAMNNKILDYKSAMVSNDSVTSEQELYIDKDGAVSTNPNGTKIDATLPAVSYEPADMVPLADALKNFKKLFPKWATTVLEEIFDNDTITGAMLAFQNNKIGSSLIGASALPNTYLPKLGTLGVIINSKWALDINGINFNKYGSALERKADKIDPETNEPVYDFGNRTQYIMSALITAMTDNAKHQYAGKFNININSLGILSNFVMLGVPLETSLMMTMNPAILKLYSDHGTGFEVKTALSKDIDSITDVSKKYKFELSNNVTDAQLVGLINSEFNLKDILSNYKEGKELNSEEQNYLQDMYSLLFNYQKGMNLSQYNFNLGTLLSLQKGISQTEDMMKIDQAIENLGLEEEKIKEENHPYDAKMLFISEKTPLNKIAKTQYDIYKDLKNNVLSQLVLTQTGAFKDLYNAITKSRKGMLGYITKRGRKKLKYDLASYLISKRYMDLLIQTQEHQSLATLNNNMIYPYKSDGTVNEKSIISVIEEAMFEKSYLETNFFLTEFVSYIQASDNWGSIHKLNNNFMAKIPNNKKKDIQDEFLKLYENTETRQMAIDIFNYLVVKDGMQYSKGSILQSISPAVTSELYQSATASVFEDFRKGNNIDLDAAYKEFTEEYFLSASIFYSQDFGFKKVKDIKTIEEDISFSEIKNSGEAAFIKNGNLIVNPYGFFESPQEDFSVHNIKSKPEQIKSFKDKLGKKGIYSKTVDGKTLFQFPALIQIFDKEEGMYVTYKLKKLITNKNENFDVNILNDEYLHSGYYAEYVVAKPVGSKQQWGGGFVFGERIETEELERRILDESLKEEEISEEGQEGQEEPLPWDNEEEVEETLPWQEMDLIDLFAATSLSDQKIKKLVDKYLADNNYTAKDFNLTKKEMYKQVKEAEEVLDEETLEDFLKCNYTKK